MMLPCIIILLFSSPGSILSQNMVIQSTDGSEKQVGLDTISIITFADAQVVVRFSTGNTEKSAISDIRKIYFKDAPVGVEEHTTNANVDIVIYPNPVGDELNIQNLPENVNNAEIITLDGTIVRQLQVISGGSINVATLPNGSYILKINNQYIKFIKL